jgi:hypothetical protein
MNVGGIIQNDFLTLPLHGGELLDPRTQLFKLGERLLNTHWQGVWAGPTSSQDTVVMRRIFALMGIEPDSAVFQSIAQSLFKDS